MGKIVIATADLANGVYQIKKTGPKKFELLPVQNTEVELNISTDTEYIITANSGIGKIIVIPTEEILFSLSASNEYIINPEFIPGSQVAIYHVDLYANTNDLHIYFTVTSLTKILLLK